MGPGILVKAPINRVRGPGTYWAGFGRKVAFRLYASHLAVAIPLRRLSRGRSGTGGLPRAEVSTARPFLGISVFNEVLESHDTWCMMGKVHRVVCRAESARSEPDAGVTSGWAPMSRFPLCCVLDFPTCCPRWSYWTPFRYGSFSHRFIPYEIGEYGNTIPEGCTVTTGQGDCFENWSVAANQRLRVSSATHPGIPSPCPTVPLWFASVAILSR